MTNSKRICEADLIVPALQLLNTAPGGFLTTTELILELEHIFEPDGDDAAILSGRQDTRFSQIVRNMISHRNDPGNIVESGYTIYDGKRKGLQITDAGRALVSKAA